MTVIVSHYVAAYFKKKLIYRNFSANFICLVYIFIKLQSVKKGIFIIITEGYAENLIE